MNTQESRKSIADRLEKTVAASVRIETHARLHVGFMDLNFSLGRHFGSVGFAIDSPSTRLVADLAQTSRITGPQAGRVAAIVDELVARLGLRHRASIAIETAIDAHSGLGSGTQLALATGTALNLLNGIDMPSAEIAALLGRGGRSGIGVGTFDAGGIVLDAGRDRNASGPPPIVWRHDMPSDWRFVLVFDRGKRGVHGAAETAAFSDIKAMAPETCGEICRLTLMQVVPSVIERDVRAFGTAVTQIQARVGDYFSPWQGGQRFASPAVAGALEWMDANGAAGIGQSSWGPTGYGIVGGLADAVRLAGGLRDRLGDVDDIEVRICAPMNRGADIVVQPATKSNRTTNRSAFGRHRE
jgi:beta-RFAP synthase